nr:L,D-transpeptidase family protein [Alsobacter soli]
MRHSARSPHPEFTVARSAPFRQIRVIRRPGDPRRGLLLAGGYAFPCALGRGGVSADKREGDGASPRATLRPLRAFYRADAGLRPRSGLRLDPIRQGDGWCDAPGDRNYNRPVRLPYPASCESMTRPDGLYDIVVDLDWNRRPAIGGRGSAIFMHVARPGFAPTEGCVALRRADLLRILPRLSAETRIVIT